MPNSVITITFNTVFVIDDDLSFDLASAIDSSLIRKFKETWKLVRNNNYLIPSLEISLSRYSSNNSGYMLDSYKWAKYFSIDFNLLSEFTVVVSNNVVQITSNSPNYIFANFSNTSDATAVISNIAQLSAFNVTNEAVTQATVNCDNINIGLTSDINIAKYILDNNEVVLNNTQLDLVYPRGVDFKIQLFDDEDRIIYYPGQTTYNPLLTVFELNRISNEVIKYDLLLAQNITPNVNVSILGATVQIVVLNVENLVLEYSLDAVTYQASNLFPGQANGDYTVYVKDQFNCLKQKDFTVDGIGTRESFAMISKANPLNFIQLEDIEGVNIFKNDSNSFGYDGFENIKYCDNTIFDNKDSTSMQIKSNFANITAKFRFESDLVADEIVIDFVKKSDNLSKYENLDCVYYKHKSGKLAIYFNSGNTYNSLGAIIGTYELNGNLPNFAKIGNVINLDGIGAFAIYNVIKDSDINKKVILLDELYNGALTVSKIECLYDLLNFDVFEAEVSFALFEVGLWDAAVELSNDENDKVTFQSENIDIQEEHKNSINIISYNSLKNNRDVFYKYGIRFFSKFYYSHVEGYTKEESEININDNSAGSIKSILNFGDQFLFEGLTKKQMEQLSIVLSSEFVFINGVGYLKDGDLDIENEEGTNVYSIKAKMLKTNENYTTQESGYSGTDELVEEIYIPTLSTDGVNFIKS
jgi:hypothetical protein